MDPVSIAGIVQNALGLGLQLGNAAKSLSNIAGKYKNAKLTLRSMAQNLEILQLTWTQIGQWFEACAEDGSFCDHDLVTRVIGFLETGTLVMEAFEKDLLAYDVENLNFGQRSKLIWNETTLQGHQVRIRDQAQSMSLFLQAIKLPTPKARAQWLRNSEDQFQKSDESAYSIDSVIPSQLSLSTSQRHSLIDSIHESLEYRPFSFENRLFMSKVYMRVSKKMMIKRIFRTSVQAKQKMSEMTQQEPDWESIRNGFDAQHDQTIGSYKDHEDRGDSRQDFDNPNNRSQESTASLIGACEQGNGVLIKDLLSGGFDIHATFTGVIYSGYKAIHVAALKTPTVGDGPYTLQQEAGRYQWYRFLIGQGAQVDAKARNDVQPIHEASWSGSIEAIDALIEAGAAIYCSDSLGYQPLHWATMSPNQPDVIRYLSGKQADLNAEISSGVRAVHLTCRTDVTNLSTLLALGAKTDYEDGTESALITAVSSGNKTAVDILLKHGVDPNHRANDDSTALHTLARLRSRALGEPSVEIEICQSLLDHGANVHMKAKNGYQVLHCLASHHFTSFTDFVAMEELACLVLDWGADPNATTSQGFGPLYLASYCGNRQLCRLLIKSGARVLRRTNHLCAKLEVDLVDMQTPEYAIDVWHNSRGSERPARWVSKLHLKLSMDDDDDDDNGYNIESALSKTLVHLQECYPFPSLIQ